MSKGIAERKNSSASQQIVAEDKVVIVGEALSIHDAPSTSSISASTRIDDDVIVKAAACLVAHFPGD